MRRATVLLVSLLGCAFIERNPDAAPEQSPAVEPAERFGVTALHPERVDLSQLGASWYLNWSPEASPGVPLEFVPIVCAFTGGASVGSEQLEALRARLPEFPDRTLFVIGSEIGHPPQNDARSPAMYVDDFATCREMILAANPTFRVSVGAIVLSSPAEYVGAKDGFDYLGQVLKLWQDRYSEPLPADFFSATAHVLQGGGMDLDVFERQIRNFRRFLEASGLRDRFVLITEYGGALGPSDPKTRAHFLTEATRILTTARDPATGCPKDDNRLVQRFAWFTADPVGTWEKLKLLGPGGFFFNLSRSALLTRDGQMTRLGVAYAQAAKAGIRAARPETPL